MTPALPAVRDDAGPRDLTIAAPIHDLRVLVDLLGAPGENDARRCRWRTLPREIALPALREAQDAGFDGAWLPPRRLADFALLAMDMDSTLIDIECVDEIADYAGCKAEVAAITEAAMRGEITDWKESFVRRLALLAGLHEDVLQRVLDERLHLNPGAPELVGAAHVAGLRTLLVSGGFTFFTERMQARMGLTRQRSNRLEIVDGRLTGRALGELVDAHAKARHLRAYAEELGVPVTRAIAMGDGANDLRMMEAAGLSVAYHAKPVVAARCDVAILHGGLDTLLTLLD